MKAQRGLSDDTINFFISQGSIAEAIRKKGNYFEPVIVFKYKDNTGFLAGASLQGIVENREHYPERGRLKQIMRNSDGQLGFSIDIGTPKRLVFAEAPIDLMSYYELHKDRLQDVRLVAMDGVKEGIISRRFMELYAEINDKSYQVNQNTGKALEVVARTTNYFKDGQHQDMITLAVDNDMAGHKFITSLQEKGIPVQIAIPPILQRDQEKEDWNDFLKGGNNTPKELAHVYTVDEKSWHYQGFFEKELALGKAQELTADDVKAFVSDRQLTREEVRQKYQTIIHQERGRENTMSESYDNGTKYGAEDVPSSPKKDNGFVIQPETQDIIDSGEVKQWTEHPNIYFVKGLRRVALELTEEGKFEQSSQYFPNTKEEKEVVNKLLSKQKKQDEVILEDDQSSELNIDTSNLSPEDAEWLKKNLNNIGFSVQSTRLVEPTTASEEKEKSLDNYQETNTGGELLNRNSSSLGVETPGTAPQPVEKNSQPDFPANVRLHFTIDEERMSNKKFRKNMRTLNLYANAMRDSAQWYLKEMSGTSIHYVYRNPEEKQFQILNVKFDKKNWMHLTGVTPVYNEWVEHLSESFVEDIAAGKGHFKDLKFANGMSDKLKVLNLLPEVIESDSFVFNDLSSVKKFNNLDLSKAIRPEDTDLLLLFKEKEFTHVPASLMRVKGDLSKQLEDIDTGTILGVYRERDGQIEQLSINDEYVKDGGEEMLSVLRNKQYEEVPKESEQTTSVNTIDKTSLDSVTFTQVLDTVYNLGVPNDISKTPEEFHKAWDQYLDYAKKYNDKFDQIVAAAGEDNLLDINTDFYKEWQQDHIYKENYHVRLQWSEERPEGPILPFKETELISYQDFARELYKANQDFYPIHQEGMRQVTAGTPEAYIPPTKIKFDIYAPDGKVIKEGIRYDVGDETKPISQMLGLGYRRLNGQSELALMDEEILSQLENKEVNKEISLEANESTRLTEEVTGQTLDTRETVAFQSSKQETKNNLLQRVEEILKEEPISNLETPEVNSSSIDYATLTPHELSEVAFQKVREYTETPERLEEYLNFMSKFPELSPRNVALIQEQWPGANAVATYNQWQSMGEVLGITSDQVFETRNTYTNKKTGRTREVVHNNLSVKTGEKSHITLFRPMMVEMIPVLDENGNQVKNGKGNPKYKRLSEATPEEKALKKEGKLKSRLFQERDSKTGLAKFATYKVFELSQTTLKPEFYPKAMPNRHYDFNMDHIRTKEVLEGLSDYAKDIGVTIYQDDAKELRSAKGAFYSDEQKILLNPDNTPGEVIATTIHELAHASLHNPKFANSYKEDVSKDRRELEAEMTSYLVSKHFGLDTSEKAIRYMALWTDNLTSLDDQQLAQSMKRIHGTVSKIVKSVEQHTKPYQLNRQVVQNQNFIQSPKKGLEV